MAQEKLPTIPLCLLANQNAPGFFLAEMISGFRRVKGFVCLYTFHTLLNAATFAGWYDHFNSHWSFSI